MENEFVMYLSVIKLLRHLRYHRPIKQLLEQGVNMLKEKLEQGVTLKIAKQTQ